jgi:hypothetical protein
MGLQSLNHACIYLNTTLSQGGGINGGSLRSRSKYCIMAPHHRSVENVRNNGFERYYPPSS